MKGISMLIAVAGFAVAAAGCNGDGEHPKRDSTPNYPADSAATPGTIADTTRPGGAQIPQGSSDTLGVDSAR